MQFLHTPQKIQRIHQWIGVIAKETQTEYPFYAAMLPGIANILFQGNGMSPALVNPVAFGELILKHIGIFLADVVERILLFGDGDLFSELSDVGFLVDKGELNKDGAVKVVQKVTPVLEDGCLVFVQGKLIVDVVIPDSLGVETAVDLADAVFAHLHIGDRLLRGLGNFLCFPVLFPLL